MTSNPPAESRPPSLRHPPGLHRPSLDRAASELFSTVGRRPPGLQRQYTEPGQDRPAKRRKVEGDVQANQAATFNNGSTATATINATTPADTKGPQLCLVAPAALQLEFGTLQDKKTSDPLVDDEPPDFPGRPWIPSQQFKAADGSQPTHRSRVYVPVPTTPDSMDSPRSAPRFVPKRPAGFFPWTGKHPEDVLSDTNVKQGYFDKPPNPTEKELNTARVPLYNAFKHKSGVDSLSTLLSLVLDKKNQQSLINPHTTFKPPPRVTLTEAKRKSWIADLANADVPLRKLSRTIPQGIRGQLLLDQCLQNFVPMSRAIWFAKCVCANEIRTLKRKGTAPALAMGAEGKWLREWTINVEQFLEAHLAQIGSTDWRTNIQYAVRITTRLYMENLLDRDHCLDWTLRSLAASPLDQLPFWLMITHIFRQDMSYYRRRGRKLAETLIEKYELVRTTAGQATAPLTQRLHHAIRGLLLTRPRNFLMPDKWPEIYPVIRTCLDEKVRQERQILEELHRINERAMGFNRREFSAKRSPVQAIVDVLDSLQAPVDVAKLAETLTTVCPDVDVVIFSCLEWACTRFQSSNARIYLFARLVRRWQRAGHATDTVILNYLSAYREGKTMTDVLCLSHLIAQLSRSDSFPTAKYLQWLMVRGLPKKGTVRLDTTTIQDAGVSSSDSGHFLLDLSLQNAAEHVLNLRNSVLERCGFDLSSERELYHHCIQYIGQELSQLGPNSRSETSSIAEPAFAILPWSIKSRISLWLRSRVVQTAMHDGPGISSSLGILSAMRLNCEQFSFIRYVLECMNDQAVLADVIGILCSSQEDDLVASLVATIQYHAESFMAIGAFEVLHKRACQIYMTWRTTKPAMTLLTNALLELCTAFPVKTPTLKFLQQNFVRGDRGRAVAACSPYSDGIAESLQQAGATFVEDFEAILQSEPNMTEQTMNGLFSVLVDRIEKQQNFGDDSPTMFSFCLLLSRLRLCRKAQADQLIQQWLGKLAPFLDGDFGPVIFQNLIGAGCLNFVGFFESISISKLGLGKLPSATALLRYVTAPDKELLGNTAFYHTRTQWSHYCHQEPRHVLEVLCQLGKESVENPSESRLLYLLTNDRTLTSSALTEPATKRLLQALDRLLCCERGGNIESANLRPLLNSVTVFSHRYVQLRLWLTSHLQAEQTAPWDQGQVVEALTDALEQMLHEVDGVQDDGSRIAQLLEAVGPEVANRLRHKVEHEFLEALPRFPPGKTTSPLSAMFPGDVHHLSSIVSRAFRVCTKNTNPMPGFAGQLIDRLSQFFKSQGNNVATPTSAAIPGLSGHSINAIPAQMMSVTSSPHASFSESVGGANGWAILNCLDHMLQMVCLQRLAVISAGRSGANVKQAQTEQVQLLVRLGLIFTHPTIASASKHLSNKQDQEKVKNVHDFILDVLATIVDEVGDEVKMMCAKLLKDKLHDARLKYLFGTVNITGSLQAQDMGHGLQMFKEGKGVIGEWRPRVWEILDNGSGKENETSLGLGLFTARRGRATED